ncbi:hypothetical protein GDO81_003099 [Engystomops pustulosus]|uniref:Activin types I and II receptor domain-containing protein n=1 Tax=Engystomops pustulosus TaxID=76066 RepID=A0AAV7A2K5_ENGPU|nr:hypothetical protein GDO81_003099 [Engystomops pustulosus]
MKLTHPLSLTILIVLSFQTANSRDCYICKTPKCDALSTTTCGGRSVCFSVDYNNGNGKIIVKGCTTQALCSQPLPFVPSGSSFNQRCCDAQLCNSAITNKISLLTAGLVALVSLYVSRL